MYIAMAATVRWLFLRFELLVPIGRCCIYEYDSLYRRLLSVVSWSCSEKYATRD